MLAIEVALLSEKGGRSYNEDACGHWHSERQLVCVLADGAGGHGGGDIASRLAVSELITRFAERPAADAGALGALLRETNRALIEQRVPGTPRQDMHSTVVCLVLDFVAHAAAWAHAGDSRLYWFRAGRLLERTRDHSLVQSLVDSGVIPEGQTRSHPRRSELRSALGIPDEVLEVSADDARAPVEPGDRFLLCTDGVWEYVEDDEMERLLADSPTPAAWLSGLEAAVRRNASHKASHDNFSAVVVWTGAA